MDTPPERKVGIGIYIDLDFLAQNNRLAMIVGSDITLARNQDTGFGQCRCL